MQAMGRHIKQSLSRSWYLPTVFLLLGMIAGELILRAKRYDSGFEPYYRGSPYVWDNHLFWKMRPNFQCRLATFEIRMNEQGFRGPSLDSWESSPMRIMCLGDSVTFGFHVEESLTFPAQVETMLRGQGLCACVANAGVPGFSSLQIKRFLGRFLGLKPHIIVLSLGGLHEGSTPWTRLSDEDRPIGWRGTLRHLLERSKLFRFLLRFVGLASPSQDDDEDSRPEQVRTSVDLWEKGTRRVPLDAYRRDLEEMVAQAQGIGARMIFVSIPVNPYEDPGAIESVDDAAIGAGLKVRAMMDDGLWGEALALMDEVLETHPHLSMGWFLRAELLEGMWRLEEAGEAYRKAYELNPKRKRMMDYRKVAEEVAVAHGLDYVDLIPTFEARWFGPGQVKTDLISDRCHPTSVGHLLIAQALVQTLCPSPECRPGPGEPSGTVP